MFLATPQNQLTLVFVDEIDGVFDGGDFFGCIIRDFDAEFFFKRHNQLNDIEAVSAQIIDEGSFFGHFVGFNTQMLNNNLFNPVCSLTHERSFLLQMNFHFVLVRWRAPCKCP
eukprot:TRINITY_DN7355_c0_g1_i1.p2 TRINITY_DN7355_c0_g1~~TRINITY_DN7355_c0_g1_i1.p2  ORF type:complete len:113 (-),score=15.77 TRINITY_DN7355_c0_g1_i1:322-660(-)